MWRRIQFDDLFNAFRDYESLFTRPLETSNLLPAARRTGEFVTSSKDRPLQGFAGCSLYPAVESFEKDGKLHLRLEMPGVEPSDVNVSIMEDRLTIGGEKKVSRETEGANLFVRELAHGTFERTFALPEGINADAVKAEYQNGVLELTLPLPAEIKPRQVKVEIGSGGKKLAA